MQAGANPNLRFQGTTAFLKACEGENDALVRLLLAHGANIADKDEEDDQSALHNAVESDVVVRNLITAGANVNAIDDVSVV